MAFAGDPPPIPRLLGDDVPGVGVQKSFKFAEPIPFFKESFSPPFQAMELIISISTWTHAQPLATPFSHRRFFFFYSTPSSNKKQSSLRIAHTRLPRRTFNFS